MAILGGSQQPCICLALFIVSPLLIMYMYMYTIWRLYFAGLYFCEFCEFGGVCKIISMKFLRLRPLKGMIPQACQA